MRLLHLDFEFFSPIDIKAAPLDVYASHPEAHILLAAYAFDDGAVKVWEADSGPCPELREGLTDPLNTVVAWNVGYERQVLQSKGMVIPNERWLDVMVLARYAGLPGRLKDCAKVPMIGVPAEEKTKSETLLINKFCKPGKDGKQLIKERFTAKDWEDWKLFIDYCRKDVLTMRHIMHWVDQRFPFPPKEREIWLLDQRINQRGVPVDVPLARAGRIETNRLIGEALNRLARITGLENANSVPQLHGWLESRGYKYGSLGADFLKQSLGDELTSEGREAVTARMESAKASVKKFAMFEQQTSVDMRLRNQFVYAGCHTLRWSGRDVQLQNLTRKKTDPETLAALIEKRTV